MISPKKTSSISKLETVSRGMELGNVWTPESCDGSKSAELPSGIRHTRYPQKRAPVHMKIHDMENFMNTGCLWGGAEACDGVAWSCSLVWLWLSQLWKSKGQQHQNKTSLMDNSKGWACLIPPCAPRHRWLHPNQSWCRGLKLNFQNLWSRSSQRKFDLSEMVDVISHLQRKLETGLGFFTGFV